MAYWTTLKAAIANVIKTNGNQEITGAVLQNTLNSIVSAVGENATFVGIANTSTNPGIYDGPVFYIATQAGVYSNFNGVEVTKGESAILKWNNGTWIKNTIKPMTDFNSVFNADGRPLTEFESGIIYDVSAHNDGAVFESLLTLLNHTNLSTLIPISARRGGMSIRFIQGTVPSSDNKYVQYRLMADEWTTDTKYWSFCRNDVYVDNPEFVEVHTDAKDKILYGVKANGDFYFGAGIPSQIKKEIKNTEVNLEHNKIDKEEGKSLINEEFANGISYQKSSDLLILTDANNSIISRVLSNGKFDFPTQKMSDVEIDDSYVYKMTDNKGRTLFGVKKDMSVDWFINVPQSLVDYVKSLIDSRLADAYQLNKAQEQNLLAAARYNTDYGKCVQMLLVSDSHGGFIGVQRAADICKNIPSVDAIIHLGDMVGWTPNELDLDEVVATVEILKTSKRPFFVVSGNHDVGTVKDIYFTRTHEQVYTDLVKPMIDNGILSNGEYQTTGDWSERCYYYHDFKTTKIRLIVLYDYDMDLVLDDNEYWEPVTYDRSKGKIERGTTYIYNPNNPTILNCGGWKNNSFRLKKTLTTTTSSVNNFTRGTFPWYKLRSFSYHSKKQMDWLANVLNTTPDGYGIVIASHQSPVFPATISDNDFSIGSNPQNTYHPNSNVPYDTVMQTALAMKIVNAWKNKTSITERIVVKDTPLQTTLQNGDYLNALEDGSGKYAYIFNADFSNRQNSNAYFINFICGHEHCDIIEQSVDYSDLFCLATTTSNPPFRYKSDMPAIENQNSPAYDCLTILTWAKDRNIACKWGCAKTIAGVDRNYVKL